MEPRYVDPENPWEDEDQLERERQTDLSDIKNLELLQKCWGVSAPGRKRFRKASEKNKWKRIERNVGKETIPLTWVENMIEWATGKNKQRIVIDFEKLMTAILNKANMTDWLAKQPKEAQVEYGTKTIRDSGSIEDL